MNLIKKEKSIFIKNIRFESIEWHIYGVFRGGCGKIVTDRTWNRVFK